MKKILGLMDEALIYEREGMNEQAINAWQKLIDTINTFNAHKVILYGIAVKQMAKEHIQKLHTNEQEQ